MDHEGTKSTKKAVNEKLTAHDRSVFVFFVPSW
jgi:hypothetical protein